MVFALDTHPPTTTMRIKIHLGNALYEINAVLFDHEPELVIGDSKLVCSCIDCDCVGEEDSDIYRDLTFGYKIYLHQRGQFWPSSDMLRLGQTKGRESLSSVLENFYLT